MVFVQQVSVADVGPNLCGIAFQLTGHLQHHGIADAGVGAGNVGEHLEGGSAVNAQGQLCGGSVASHIDGAGIGSILCNFSSGQGSNIAAHQGIGGGVCAIQAAVNGEGSSIAIGCHLHGFAADGNAHAVSANHPLAFCKLVITGIHQHGAVCLQVSGGVLFAVHEGAHMLRSGKLLLVGLDEGIGIGKCLGLAAGHGHVPGVACAGHNGEGHVEGVFPGDVIGISSLGVCAAGCFQLNLEAGHAVLLHFLPLAGQVTGAVGGVGGSGAGIVVAISVLVANGSAVFIQVQQKCGSQHGGILAFLAEDTSQLIALGCSRSLRGGFGSGSGLCVIAAACQQGCHHGNCQQKCKNLFHRCVPPLIFHAS